jgi:putative ABC transport system permease protein
MGALLQDLRFAVRSFLRSPRFTIPAILALAVGVGSTSAIFSIVESVVLRPLPYDDPDRIVVVWEHNVQRNRPRNVIAPANFVEWRERNRSFEYLAMVGPSRQAVMINGQPEEAAGLFASSELFPALGVQPALGRAYTAREDERGNDLVIVLGHDYWRSRFAGRTDVLGQTLITSGRPRVVVGVMPPGFTVAGQRADYLIPYGWLVEDLRSARGRGSSHGVARLRDGVSVEQGQAEMKSIMAQLEK